MTVKCPPQGYMFPQVVALILGGQEWEAFSNLSNCNSAGPTNGNREMKKSALHDTSFLPGGCLKTELIKMSP